MAQDKKLVEAITSMEEDFAQWYTDVVRKAELMRLHQRKRLHGHQTGWLCHLGEHPAMSWTAVSKRLAWRTFIFRCSFPRACFRRRRIMWKALLPR